MRVGKLADALNEAERFAEVLELELALNPMRAVCSSQPGTWR
jgi:hypothetical protein